MVKLRFACNFLLVLVTLNLSAQSLTRSVISVTGISTIDNMGQLSYSAGESVTGCLVSQVNCITQGFQQPSLLYFFKENVLIDINAVEVFPNPVIKNLTILFTSRTEDLLFADLYSGQGTIIRSLKYSFSEAGWIEIEMENLNSGLYLLHVYSADKLIDRVFKIEKL
jgi:hypothetical protein